MPNPRVFVIAEAGSNHDGSLKRALRLVDIAKQCDADAVKFQYWSNADRMAERRQAPDYRDVYAKYQMPATWLLTLSKYAENCGIEFMCSTYLPEDVEVVAPFVKRFKIASFEANDTQQLAAHAPHLAAHKQVIISMGMGARYEPIFDNLVSPAFERGGNRSDLMLLHCVSAYPTPHDQLNLSRLHGRWPTGEPMFDGFSDHSGPMLAWTGALAVAAGARIIERHFRSSDTDVNNPDFPHAATPSDFAGYVSNIRYAEETLGDGARVQTAEHEMMRYRVR